MKANAEWYMIWYEPGEDEHVAYMSLDRIQEIGGWDPNRFMLETSCTDQGVSIIIRWCRKHCSTIPRPVSVRGKTGFVFNNLSDAMLFKVTWGG